MTAATTAALALVMMMPCALGADEAAGVPPRATAVRLLKPPVLDGVVRDDPAWAAATPLTDWWQTTPDAGQPATEATEVRIAYTADTLYFGIVCHDRQKILVSEGRRDSPLGDSDSFQIVLDTFHDRQGGFVFGTTPGGLEYDGQVANEGRDSETGQTQQGGALHGFNVNWDGSWQVRTQVGDFGWSAEFAIPFRTLRYPRGKSQVWGLNLQRNLRRRKETAYWAPLPSQYNLHRVSLAGTLSGLEVEGQRNLKIVPYGLGQAARDVAAGTRTETTGAIGLDLKYSLTPGLTLDATVNTDFAQVEVDEQQVNLDRFNLFFPEKRPFFLENAGQFSAGSPGEVELFFTRRIGIGPNGEAVPILGGARLSGKLAGASIGVLDMQTRAVSGVVRANNFMVARVGRELRNRSGVAAVFVNRQGTGEGPSASDHNRTFGLDGHWGAGRYGQLSGFLAKTASPGKHGDDYAFQVAAVHDSPGWQLIAKHTQVGEHFNPEAGFLRRSGFRKPELLVFRRYRPRHFLGLHEVRPHASWRGYYKPDGFLESGFLHVDNHLEWKSGHQIHTGVNFTREGLRSPFAIYPGIVVPPGAYEHKEVQLVAQSNEGAPLSLTGRLTAGGFFGGRRLMTQPSLRLRKGDTLAVDLRWERNRVDLPGGRFVTNLSRLRASYSFSPRLFTQALVQYNDRAKVFSTNLRLGFIQTANTGFFLVLGETHGLEGSVGGPRNRSLVVKFSRLLDLLG